VQSNLDFEIIAPDQSTVLVSAASQGAGVSEVISSLDLADGAGTYYIHVNGDTDQVQLYDLLVSLSCDLDEDCDVDANDLAALVLLWLEDCQINNCGGANLVVDAIVDWQDFAVLEQHWLIDLN